MARFKILTCATTVAIVAMASTAFAKTWSVGPTRASKTLGAVASQLSPGDVVELDGDATYAGGIVLTKPGTAQQPITIRGIRVNGKRPILSGGTTTIEARGDHYVFEGLEITGGSSRCFYHHADDVTLQDSVIHDCAQHGVLGADADSGSMSMEYDEVYACGEGTQHHQVYMATDETAHPGAVFLMRHCYIHDGNGGNNVKSRAEHNDILENWIEGAMYHELELIGPDGQDPALAREDSDVVGNVLVKTNTSFVVRFGGDGTGATDGRYRFVNNTVITRSGGSAVFRLFDGIESVEMDNNVFFATGGSVNLVRDTEAVWVNGRQVSGANNWVLKGASSLPSEWTTTIAATDPGFVDAASLDLEPAATSALVDSGATLTDKEVIPGYLPPLHELEGAGTAQPRALAGRIDIGAYEYASGGGGNGTGGSGGTTGAGGSAGTGASAGTGGSPASGGTSGTAGSGGTSGTAGSGASGGTSGTAGSGASGGTSGTAGSGASGGTAGSAGATGNAGSAGATGNAGSAGATGNAGSAGATGNAGSAGSVGSAGANANADAASSSGGTGCSCRAASKSASSSGLWALGLVAMAGATRRRRRRAARAV